MPESIRNAIVIAFVAVLVAMVGVGLLLWRGRPAAPAARPAQGLPLLVTDRNGGIYDLNIKLQRMERRVGESQVVSQRLTEELTAANAERQRLASRLSGLEKEVRKLRVRVQDTEQRTAPQVPFARPMPTTPPASAPVTSSPAPSETPPPPPP